MGQTRDEIAQNLAERLCWQVARRDDSWVARRLYRKQVVDGVYRLDEGALLDDFFCFLHQLGVVDLQIDCLILGTDACVPHVHGHPPELVTVQFTRLGGIKRTLFSEPVCCTAYMRVWRAETWCRTHAENRSFFCTLKPVSASSLVARSALRSASTCQPFRALCGHRDVDLTAAPTHTRADTCLAGLRRCSVPVFTCGLT